MSATAHRTHAGEALRIMLPASTDPYALAELAAETAFLVRDRNIAGDAATLARVDPDLAAALIVTLAAMIDVDRKPADLLSWLGTGDQLADDSARTLGALAEARLMYEEAGGDTLPPVTLESMRAAAHAAALAGTVQPCGTVAAERRHQVKKSRPCVRCAEARRIYDRATPEERAWLKTMPVLPGQVLKVKECSGCAPVCGTAAGYDAHLKLRQPPCADCQQVVAGLAGNTLPPVTLDSIAALAIAAKLAGVPHPCGTPGAWVRHRRHGEVPCPRCTLAYNIVDRATPEERTALQDKIRKAERGTSSCGTASGYALHRYYQEDPCDPCIEGRREADREYAANRRASRRAPKPAERALVAV